MQPACEHSSGLPNYAACLNTQTGRTNSRTSVPLVNTQAGGTHLEVIRREVRGELECIRRHCYCHLAAQLLTGVRQWEGR